MLVSGGRKVKEKRRGKGPERKEISSSRTQGKNRTPKKAVMTWLPKEGERRRGKCGSVTPVGPDKPKIENERLGSRPAQRENLH